MKVNKYIISALVCPFVLGSCADWDDWKYDVEKPQTIAQYEYLNDYAPLKEYLDRGAHPGFKVSAALGVDEFNQQVLSSVLQPITLMRLLQAMP